MAYNVRFTDRAERDFASLFEQIDAEESDAALKWFRGLTEAVLSLEEMPHRCPATPEKPQFRHLLYGHKNHVYRVIFRVLEVKRTVEVLHLRHGARRRFKVSDLEE